MSTVFDTIVDDVRLCDDCFVTDFGCRLCPAHLAEWDQLREPVIRLRSVLEKVSYKEALR